MPAFSRSSSASISAARNGLACSALRASGGGSGTWNFTTSIAARHSMPFSANSPSMPIDW